MNFRFLNSSPPQFPNSSTPHHRRRFATALGGAVHKSGKITTTVLSGKQDIADPFLLQTHNTGVLPQRWAYITALRVRVRRPVHTRHFSIMGSRNTGEVIADLDAAFPGTPDAIAAGTRSFIAVAREKGWLLG